MERVPAATATLDQMSDDLDLAAAIDLLPHGFIALDLRLNTFFASRGAHELFGYPGDTDMIGVSALDLLHPGDLERVALLFSDLTDNAEDRLASPSIARHVEMSVRVRHASGEWIAVGATGRLVSEQGPFFLSVRPNLVNRTIEDLLRGLALGFDTDQLIEIVAEMTVAQFPCQTAWVVSDLDSSIPNVRGAFPLGHAIVEEAIAVTGRRITSVGGGDYWSVDVVDADGRRIGLLVVSGHRDGADASPYDIDILGRTSQVASLVLQRELADEALRLGDEFAVLCRRIDERATTEMVGRVRSVLDIADHDGSPDDPRSSVADMYANKRVRRVS